MLPASRPIVILESPFAGDVKANREYAIRCIRDSLDRGESPIASHILYTEALNDTIPEERNLGIEAGLAIARVADKTVVYTDRGISTGMEYGIKHAEDNNRPIEFRTLHDNK